MQVLKPKPQEDAASVQSGVSQSGAGQTVVGTGNAMEQTVETDKPLIGKEALRFTSIPALERYKMHLQRGGKRLLTQTQRDALQPDESSATPADSNFQAHLDAAALSEDDALFQRLEHPSVAAPPLPISTAPDELQLLFDDADRAKLTDDERAWADAIEAGEIDRVVKPEMNYEGKGSVVGTGMKRGLDSTMGGTELMARHLWYLLDPVTQRLYLQMYPKFYQSKTVGEKRAA